MTVVPNGHFQYSGSSLNGWLSSENHQQPLSRHLVPVIQINQTKISLGLATAEQDNRRDASTYYTASTNEALNK
jgi:hypothetical protein